MTWGDIITGALQDIGVIPEEETAGAPDLATGITKANALLASWSLDGANLFTKKRRKFQLVAGRATIDNPYQIGPNAADFNVPRPILWESASCIHPNGFRSEVSILNSKQFAAIQDMTETALVPDKVYLDGEFLTADGRSQVYTHPTNTLAPFLETFGWEAFTRIALASDDFLFPDGYERAIRSALAIELIPSYPAGQRSQETINALLGISQIAKQSIQNVNQQTLGLALTPSVTLKGASQGLPMGQAPPAQ